MLVGMDDILESHQSFTLIDASCDAVVPALIGGARALYGLVAWDEGERRRVAEISDPRKGLADFYDLPLTVRLPPIVIHEAGPERVLIEDTFNEPIAKTLSLLLNEATVLGTESWAEGTVRESHRIVVFREGLAIRRVGSSKGTEKRGWVWEDEGAVTPWEDPLSYSAPSIGARMTRADIRAAARAFGVDIEAVLAGEGRGGAVALLSHYDPDTPDLVTYMHMDLSERAVAAGHGDPLHLEPFDPDEVAEILEQMRQSG